LTICIIIKAGPPQDGRNLDSYTPLRMGDEPELDIEFIERLYQRGYQP
jgi:hypothetical protein